MLRIGRLDVTLDHPNLAQVITPAAADFLYRLHQRFEPTRKQILARRVQRQAEIDAGAVLLPPAETAAIRIGEWRVADCPADLADRRVEITGPCERKMMINALNSGARVFMADCEDAQSPTWDNQVRGQVNLAEAVRGTLALDDPQNGKSYRLNERTATLLVRPRGWHLPEKHVLIDGERMSGSLFDAGLYLFHNAHERLARGTGPYFYLPKQEHYQETRLWNDVFVWCAEVLAFPRGRIRATMLIETIHAAHQMDEMLWEMREHSAGLNAGRWDYIFSCIKTFRAGNGVFPDRGQLTMTAPFMHAYTELLVRTCHRRGAHAIGGMSAFIPNRRDAQVTSQALERVRADKEREAAQGFDGTWVAHPDLVAVAGEVFDRVLAGSANQVSRQRLDVPVATDRLTAFAIPDGRVTIAGVRENISIGLQYLAAWLSGNGAVAINNLMEDAATSEISRSLLWSWLRHGVALAEGGRVDQALYARMRDEVVVALGDRPKLIEACALLDRMVGEAGFPDFLTLPAYEALP